MNQKHLTQIWQWASVVCLLFLAASVISIQGGSEFVGRLFGDKGATIPDNKPAIGYFAAIIGAGLFLVASLALRLHASRHGTCWHERVPVLWLEGLNTFAWEAKLFQAAVLFLFLALPAAGIVKSIVEAERGDICELDTEHFYKGSETTLLWPPASLEGHQMRLRRAGADSEPCKSGIEIFPRSWTPLLIYGLPIVSGMMALAALVTIFWIRAANAVPLPAPDTGVTE
jgi:hypothetical protein